MSDIFLAKRSFSAVTMRDLRETKPKLTESYQDWLHRLSMKYGLSVVEVRLLIQTPSLDQYGRHVGPDVW